eukprot:scaffold125103_cov30-Phaeocystis_antarctica.AAC.1
MNGRGLGRRHPALLQQRVLDGGVGVRRLAHCRAADVRVVIEAGDIDHQLERLRVQVVLDEVELAALALPDAARRPVLALVEQGVHLVVGQRRHADLGHPKTGLGGG